MPVTGRIDYCSNSNCKTPHKLTRLRGHGLCGACLSRERYSRVSKEVRAKKMRDWLNKYPEQRLRQSARQRAKKLGLPFNLSKTDIQIPAKCPILGIELKVNSQIFADNSPTLDRLIPEKGYVKGNVMVVSFKANRLRNNASLDELRKITEFYSRLLE